MTASSFQLKDTSTITCMADQSGNYPRGEAVLAEVVNRTPLAANILSPSIDLGFPFATRAGRFDDCLEVFVMDSELYHLESLVRLREAWVSRS